MKLKQHGWELKVIEKKKNLDKRNSPRISIYIEKY